MIKEDEKHENQEGEESQDGQKSERIEGMEMQKKGSKYSKTFAKIVEKITEHIDPTHAFDKGSYSEWQKKRIKYIENHYGKEWFKGKKILEVGCGFGHIGAYFSELGGDVTCSDARQEYLDVINDRHPKIKTVQADLDDTNWRLGEDWDLILHLGTVYHLGDHTIPLIQACSATKHMVLESECCDSDSPYDVIFQREDTKGIDYAYNLRGITPSAANIERVLDFCGVEYQRCDDPQLNTELHTYDWESKNSGVFYPNHRRFWFIRKKTALK